MARNQSTEAPSYDGDSSAVTQSNARRQAGTISAVVLGAVFGAPYNILDRVSLPRIPVSTSQLSMGGNIAAVLILFGTLLAAMAGGNVGHRYHDMVDRAAVQ